jgi:Meiotically up-regulated gene 113
MTQKNDFLTSLRAAAEGNGGRPLGETQFYRQAGLTRKDLWSAGYDNYGAACEAAGLQANTFVVQRMSDDDLFRPLAALTRKLGKFPAKGAFKVARTHDTNFPGWDTFKRRERQGPEGNLRDALLAWCRKTTEFSDVGELLGLAAANSSRQQRVANRQVVNGHVYLMRYGSGGAVYKVGLSDNVPRRHAQLNMMTPQDMRVVHTIPTDDPRGIEEYWKKRFEPKRLEGKKELFRLTPDDVASFKSRKYQ